MATTKKQVNLYFTRSTERRLRQLVLDLEERSLSTLVERLVLQALDPAATRAPGEVTEEDIEDVLGETIESAERALALARAR